MVSSQNKGRLILSPVKMDQKINRMAYQLLEENYEKEEILLAGIQGPGNQLAHLVNEKLKAFSDKKVTVHSLQIDKENPQSSPVQTEPELNPENKTVVLMDDVLNTGRTMFHSLSPFQSVRVEKLQLMVLVFRSHNSFPLIPDFTGLSLATTLRQHIHVEFEGEEKGVYLY